MNSPYFSGFKPVLKAVDFLRSISANKTDLLIKAAAVTGAFLLVSPGLVLAVTTSDTSAITQIAFTTEAQTVAPGEISKIINVQAQDASGNPISFNTSGTKLELTSISPTGEFSSSNTTWEPVTSLTVNKGWTGRNFYYKDLSTGTFALNAKINATTLAGQTVSWQAMQNIIIGTAASNTTNGTGTTTDTGVATSTATSTTTNQTSTTTPTIITRTVTRYISVHSSEEDLSDFNTANVLAVSAGRDRLSYTGTPISFEAKINNQNLSGYRKYIWTFGDGTSFEGEKVNHTYKFPGDYNLILNAEIAGQKAVTRITVKILKPEVVILENSEESVTLSNKGQYEVNLGDWSITDDKANKFTFPIDTIIGPKQNLVLPVEEIKINNGSALMLSDPSNKIRSSIERKNILAVSPDVKITNSVTINNNSTPTIEDISRLVEANRSQLESEAGEIINKNGLVKNDNYNIASVVYSPVLSREGKPTLVSTTTQGKNAGDFKKKGFWSGVVSLPGRAWKGFVGLFYSN
ncbi:MAG: PKD domain-containing protein [bacterium]